MTDERNDPESPTPHVEALLIGPPPPALGTRVYYRGKRGFQAVRAADISCTLEYLDPRGVAAGSIPGLSSFLHVHLHVITPGERGHFSEYDVPFDPDLPPGTWRWCDGMAPRNWMTRYEQWINYHRRRTGAQPKGEETAVLMALNRQSRGGPGLTNAELAQYTGLTEQRVYEAIEVLARAGLVDLNVPDQPSGDSLEAPPGPPASGETPVTGIGPDGGGPTVPEPADGGPSSA